MARGISLHIGLNHVDLSQYPGFSIPVLSGCINDANSMSDIAKSTGFSTSTTLIDQQATAMEIKNKISDAASQLVSGDIFFLTYSGHGSQIPDESGEEDDGQNETWVCYDRQLIDDELYTLWQSFKENVRIFVLSDSCHSGTMVKMLISDFIQGKLKFRKGIGSKNFTKIDVDQLTSLTKITKAIGPHINSLKKAIPFTNSLNNYLLKKELYQNIQQLTKIKKAAGQILASLIYISGCQDNQTSGDGPKNGIFTGNLINVWDNGSFTGNYKTFYNRILSLMNSDQSPNYLTLGISNDPFEIQKPFTILSANDSNNDGGDGTTVPDSNAKPSITGPTSWSSNSLPPSFNVIKGSNPYYYIEVATDSKFFNDGQHGAERTDQNFFATWNDPTNNYELFEDPQYQLPQQVWNNFKSANKIYYRLGTTIDSNWNGWMVTVEDDNYQNAPYLNIVQDDSSSNNNDTSNDTTSSNDTPDSNSEDGDGTTAPVTIVKPDITGPASWNSNSSPPSFKVIKGSNPYYYVEVATDSIFFNDAQHGAERTDQNFFATWNDPTNNYKLFEDTQYQLPQQVWNNFMSATKIYYRLGTTVDNNWTGWMVTVEDSNYLNAPYINIE